jgi:alkaline phosphatase
MKRLLLLLIILQSCQNPESSKGKFTGHSHNDYYQQKPFYTAWENYFASIEADVWEVNGDLYIAHDFEEITSESTLERLYLQPIDSVFESNNGKAWADYEESFILLVDLKTEYEPTLHILIELLKSYRETFDPAINPNAARIVISGNIPPPDLFYTFPEYIFFDGRMENTYNEDQLNRVALFSNNINDYVNENYNGQLTEREAEKLLEYISKAHTLGKKVRFWGAPDTPETWKKLQELGVDLINTDSPEIYYKFMTE